MSTPNVPNATGIFSVPSITSKVSRKKAVLKSSANILIMMNTFSVPVPDVNINSLRSH